MTEAATPPGRHFRAVPAVTAWGTITAWVAASPGVVAAPRFPLVLLHGFTGSAHAWGTSLLDSLAAGRTVVAVDLPGHGASDWPIREEEASIPALAALLAELLPGWIGEGEEGVEPLDTVAANSGRAVWLGYSLGGRVALAVGVEQPAVVAALILESSSPGLEAEDERIARVAADEALARSLQVGGIGSFVERWLALPLFGGLRALPEMEWREERLRRLRNRPEALAGVLRHLGTGSQPDYRSSLSALSVPTLLLTGSADPTYCGITREMAHLIPGARRVEFPGVGHVPHREEPEGWLRAVATFLDALEGQRGASGSL